VWLLGLYVGPFGLLFYCDVCWVCVDFGAVCGVIRIAIFMVIWGSKE